VSQISANELKRKLNLLVDGHPYTVVDVHYATPSARGASTLVKVKLRSLLNGLMQEKTFKTAEKFEEPDIERTPVAFLYTSGREYHFMDNGSYEQFFLTEEQLGDQKYYLKEGMEMNALKYNGRVVSLELPAAVELKVADTEPSIKGASASGRSTKKATLETGLETLVPLYIEPGTLVRVNTQTGEVTGRA